MKLLNSGKEFEIQFDGIDHTIPGNKEFEVADDNLGNFILAKTRQWGIPVAKTADSNVAAIKAIEAIVEEPKEEEVKEEIKEESKTKTKTKTKK